MHGIKQGGILFGDLDKEKKGKVTSVTLFFSCLCYAVWSYIRVVKPSRNCGTVLHSYVCTALQLIVP